MSCVYELSNTLIARTSSAVAFATSLADCTKRRRAIEFVVFDDASREILHKTDVFFAIVAAKVKILTKKKHYLKYFVKHDLKGVWKCTEVEIYTLIDNIRSSLVFHSFRK